MNRLVVALSLVSAAFSLPAAAEPTALTARVAHEIKCADNWRDATSGIALHEGTGRVVCATMKGLVTAFDLGSGSQLWRTDLSDPANPEPSGQIYHMTFDRAGERLVVAGRYGQPVILDAATGAKQLTLAPLEGKCKVDFHGPRFSADEARVFAVSDGWTCVWDAATGAASKTLGRSNINAMFAAESADPARIYVVVPWELYIDDAATGERLAVRAPFVLADDPNSSFEHVYLSAAALSPDRKSLAMGVYQSIGQRRLYAWQVIDVESRRLLGSGATDSFVHEVSFSGDGRELRWFEAATAARPTPRWVRHDLLSGTTLAVATADQKEITDDGAVFVWFGLESWFHPIPEAFAGAVTMDSGARARIWHFE